MNPALRTTFDWLRLQGLPPLPVAPAQDPTRYPARNRDGSLKRDKDGTLIPAFTGKNPSYVDIHGIPHLIRHTQYQNRLPTQAELQTWFAHPDNGIGTLGGWHDIVWVDVDVKQFESQQTCDQQISDWLSQYPLLQQTFTERTHSGGWRLAVRVHEKSFTNFSLDGVGGQHMGEALGQGRFTVLSPTVGPSGKAYVNVQRVPPVWVERLDAIGLYPVSGRKEQVQSRQSWPRIKAQPAQPGVLRLEELAAAKAQAVLHGDSQLESRSHSLTYALREFYGWENWASQNQVPISGNAEELARAAGAALGIDAERVERIMESIPDPGRCTPAAVFAGGETSAWKRVWKLDQRIYQLHCPEAVVRKIHDAPSQNLSCAIRSLSTARSDSTTPINSLPDGVSRYRSQEVRPSATQVKRLIQYAWHVLDSMGQPRNQPEQLKDAYPRWFQGQMYRLEAEETHLVIKAHARGVILEVEDGRVTSTKLTLADIQRFQAVSSRIQLEQLRAKGQSICPLTR